MKDLDDPFRVAFDCLLGRIPCAEAHGYSRYALRAKTSTGKMDLQILKPSPHVTESFTALAVACSSAVLSVRDKIYD